MPDGLGTVGKLLVIVGAGVVLIGLILILVERYAGLRIGRLPGDICIERDGWRFYFPLATAILLSIILSLVVWLLKRR
jgi:hypothetical protein